jgi:hypothetical protein
VDSFFIGSIGIHREYITPGSLSSTFPISANQGELPNDRNKVFVFVNGLKQADSLDYSYSTGLLNMNYPVDTGNLIEVFFFIGDISIERRLFLSQVDSSVTLTGDISRLPNSGSLTLTYVNGLLNTHEDSADYYWNPPFIRFSDSLRSERIRAKSFSSNGAMAWEETRTGFSGYDFWPAQPIPSTTNRLSISRNGIRLREGSGDYSIIYDPKIYFRYGLRGSNVEIYRFPEMNEGLTNALESLF